MAKYHREWYVAKIADEVVKFQGTRGQVTVSSIGMGTPPRRRAISRSRVSSR